jgi:hypothetical protein
LTLPEPTQTLSSVLLYYLRNISLLQVIDRFVIDWNMSQEEKKKLPKCGETDCGSGSSKESPHMDSRLHYISSCMLYPYPE